MKKIFLFIAFLSVSFTAQADYFMYFPKVTIDQKNAFVKVHWILILDTTQIDEGDTSIPFKPVFSTDIDSKILSSADRVNVIQDSLVNWAAYKVKLIKAADEDATNAIAALQGLAVGIDADGNILSQKVGSPIEPVGNVDAKTP